MTTWTDRRVLVTGADGFIGSHLVERLVQDGANVTAFCLYNPRGSWGWLDQADASVRATLDVRLGDIRDRGFVVESFNDVEVVFHLAALIGIPYSYQAPESYLSVNVEGTLNVLEAARAQGVRRVVQTSTSEVYGNPEVIPIRESHPLRAQSPYAATKIAADQLALAYFHSFGVPVTIIRPFNTYGPRQSARAVLATILAQLIAGRSEIELGRLDVRRDLTYVADTVDGLLRGGSVPDIEGQTIHLGTGRTVSVQELFDICAVTVGSQATVKLAPKRLRPDASEIEVLQSAPDRAKGLLGWEATTTLEQGVRMTAEWVRENIEFFRPDELHV